MPESDKKCWGAGCRRPPTWACRRLWGDGGRFFACDEHRPGTKESSKIPLKRKWYDVQPIGK